MPNVYPKKIIVTYHYFHLRYANVNQFYYYYHHHHSLVLTSSAEFSIWTREAGAGGLSIAVEGPSKAEISFEDRKDGSCGVSYIVKEPGINL